jgi:hypothetical protein
MTPPPVEINAVFAAHSIYAWISAFYIWRIVLDSSRVTDSHHVFVERAWSIFREGTMGKH